MANQPNMQPWWHRTNKETLDDRVKAVQNVNDPSIVSDDVQRWSKIALMVLLAFTTLLSGASYLKFFEKSFGFEIALLMALSLAVVIEFGKNWGFLKVLRIPFFQGWNFIWREVHNTVMWVFLLLLSVVTFTASIYNSTQGSHQLALLLSHERTYTAFVPNTTDIDNQITSLQREDEKLGNIRRSNGRTNWAIQPMKAENAKTLQTLQAQRQTLIAQQRTDWEKQDAIKNQQNQFSANSLLAVGGWVELLQIILMFVRISAERSLDRTAQNRRQEAPYPAGNGQPAFNNHATINTQTAPPHQNTNGHAPINNHNKTEAQQRYYFVRTHPAGNIQAALDQQPLFQPQKTVSQSDFTVTQQKTGNYADDVLTLAEKRIRGHFANFGRRQGKDSTVSDNINTILDETLQKMKAETFQPSYMVSVKFYAYVNELFEALDTRGWPYDKKGAFLANTHRRIPQPAQ